MNHVFVRFQKIWRGESGWVNPEPQSWGQVPSNGLGLAPGWSVEFNSSDRLNIAWNSFESGRVFFVLIFDRFYR